MWKASAITHFFCLPLSEHIFIAIFCFITVIWMGSCEIALCILSFWLLLSQWQSKSATSLFYLEIVPILSISFIPPAPLSIAQPLLPPPVQFTFTLAYRICIDSYQLSNVKHKYEAQNGYYLYFERYLRLNRNSLIIILFRSHSNKKIIGNFNVSTMMFIIIVYFDQSEIILFNDHWKAMKWNGHWCFCFPFV